MDYASSYERLEKFINGEPMGELAFLLAAGAKSMRSFLGRQPTEEDKLNFRMSLGSVAPLYTARPYAERSPGVTTESRQVRDEERIEYTTPHGSFTETRIDGQITDFKLKTPADLEVFINVCNDAEIEADDDAFAKVQSMADGRSPVGLTTGPSPVQRLIQRETGVANFYFLLMDAPGLMEAVMEALQEQQRQRYNILPRYEGDYWYQGENTSTTMISPDYYEKYSLPHIKEFADSAHAGGKRAIVHMCGLLHGLLPLFRKTGMDGIHSLTPPPTGDVPFEKAYECFPADFSILGRFGSVQWVGRDKAGILQELEKTVPRDIFRERPFMLWVTADQVEDISRENFYALRDAIAEYNKRR